MSLKNFNTRPFSRKSFCTTATSRIYPTNFDLKRVVTLPSMDLAYIKFIENVLNGRT